MIRKYVGHFFLLAATLLGLFGCDNQEATLSAEKAMLSFAVEWNGKSYPAQIDPTALTVRATVPAEADLGRLKAVFEVSPQATVTPGSGQENNFSNPAIYDVTAQDGTSNVYTVYVGRSMNRLLKVSLPTYTLQAAPNKDDVVELTVPYEADLTQLAPVLELDAQATVVPASGSVQNFTEPVRYTVTDKQGNSRAYTVKVVRAAGSDANALLTANLPGLYMRGTVSGNQVTFDYKAFYGTDLSKVRLEFTVSPKAKAKLANGTEVVSGTLLDLRQPLQLTVVSQTGKEQIYTLKVESDAVAPEGVRGVWVTNVASQALSSVANIKEMVDRCDRLGFNTLFVVTYNKSMTLHPSKVLSDVLKSSDATKDKPTQFYGETAQNGFDPLKVVIDEAHARGLKVVAWFEYGFASHWGANGYDPLLKAKPHWASKDRNGNLANKNDFYWLNGFHPEVQQFMRDLFKEVVANYDVDGVQGDDRLPAMPSTAGYDDYTLNRYIQEKGLPAGTKPTESDRNWLQWRADILSKFGEDIYKDVKAIDSNCLVTWSPSAWDFSFYNYLQDWVEWKNRGIADMLSPQVYRYEFDSYSWTLAAQMDQLGTYDKKRFAPGVILASGGTIISEEMIVKVVRENRRRGLSGEVFFFYEGLSVRENAFKIVYPTRAKFPTF